MKKILFNILLLIFALCLVGCDLHRSSLPKEMPDDFSFTLTFGFDGYYNSKTGLLENGYNYDLNAKCQTILIFDKNELKEIYNIFRECAIDKWETELTVSDQMMDPSYDIVITYTENGKTNNITIFGASFISVDEWTYGTKLGEAYYQIVDDYIISSEEFKSLPENQNLYD